MPLGAPAVGPPISPATVDALVQLVPQFEIGLNCSDCLLRLAQPDKQGP